LFAVRTLKEIAAIAAVVNPAPPKQPKRDKWYIDALTPILRWTAASGYRPMNGDIDDSVAVFPLGGEGRRQLTLVCEPGTTYFFAAVNQRGVDIDMAVFDARGMEIASDMRDNADPSMVFQVPRRGRYTVVVMNASDDDTLVILTLWKK
jgi:hypothetical protein